MTAFIWDLDGTLVDSYGIILSSIEASLKKFGLDFNYKEAKDFITKKSVTEYLKEKSSEYGINHDEVSKYYKETMKEKNLDIKPFDDTVEILDWTQEQGIMNFIYTHKSNLTFDLLKKLEIEHYFEEVITSDNNFERKPSPQAVDYLLDKYELDKSNTYYIGDRPLDYEVAMNAGIKSINLLIPYTKDNVKISKLTDIKDIML